MVTVKLKEIGKNFGEVKIINGVNWEILKGELMVLVGPSGCGKTTLLKIILGVLDPDNGEIYFNQKLMNKVSISERNVGFVPQNFGLFPHLNVNENIGYGLKMRNIPKNKIEMLTNKFIGMLKLEGLGLRATNQLSWGQRQRVALARALAIEPSLLLLDEPLSAVDWASRKEITDEINRMQKRLRITTIYVTHDINEAFEIGDRIAVMHDGKIEQCDRAECLIKTPKSNFIAAYLKNRRVGK
ncbi:MAG: ABC transporter ATP-binding protein [Promethearchaeota archaeon]|nr:MAG: ABC transporter ATP-binding protein [Candidatus Lokiarchaeota archaeon]